MQTPFFLRAQYQYLNEVNLELRHIFSQISYPDNDVLFLYERSAKVSDSVFYQNSCDSVSNLTIWNTLYEEMYYAAHDTSNLVQLADIQSYSHQFYGDTIPIALMDYDFYYCKPQAMNTGDYFLFDTVINQLFDHPNSIDTPFGRSNIFAGSPLKGHANFADPIFRIDPNLFFTDSVNIPLYAGLESLRINFDDGTGWHYFDMTVLSHYQAQYDSAGPRVITFELYDLARDESIKHSESTIMVLRSNSKITPDEILYLPGLEIGIYYACGSEDEARPIIYLEGIDILDVEPLLSRGLDEIYYDMINSQYIEELRNFNYTFYVVNWKNSRLDMRFNALYVVNLIEYLKNEYSHSEEQFVILGESMGGVIARYALTFMESQYYASGIFSPFFLEANHPDNLLHIELNPGFMSLGGANRNEELLSQQHKTRLLITIDSPHQGANIPISIQLAYKKLLGHIVPGNSLILSAFNIGLESKAAKQLLLYHVGAQPLSQINNQALPYFPHPSHYSFYGQLRDLGDYPEYCKLVALSSGDLSGKRQREYSVSSFPERIPNDVIVDFNTKFFARVLWIPTPILSVIYKLQTNPDGSNQVYSAAIGNFTLSVKLKWFGVNVTHVYGNLYSDNQIAENVKPYCVSSGGYFWVPINNPGQSNNSSQFNFDEWWLQNGGDPTLNFYGHNFNSSNGCITLAAHAGLNGFSSLNLNFSLCVPNGLDFGFVPTQSALDYGRGLNLPLNHNILNEDINLKLYRTPFDVIIGYPDGYNRNHLHYRDEKIYNLTGAPAANCGNQDASSTFYENYTYYDADLQSECRVLRSLLCLEIGDEQLYLENWTLNRQATFSTQYDMFINERNPYYTYPSQANLEPAYAGSFSKEAPFQVASNGFAHFLYNDASPSGNAWVYNAPFSDSIDRESRVMQVCVNDYAQGKSYQVIEDTPETDQYVYTKLFPNPNNGEVMVLEYDFFNDEAVHLQIFDVSGKSVHQQSNLASGANRIRLHLNDLESGLYLVKIFTGTQSQIIRLIIH